MWISLEPRGSATGQAITLHHTLWEYFRQPLSLNSLLLHPGMHPETLQWTKEAIDHCHHCQLGRGDAPGHSSGDAKLDDSNRLLQLLNTINMVCTESLAAAVVIVHLWEFIVDNK